MHVTLHTSGRLRDRRPVALLVALAALALGTAWNPPSAHALDLTTCTGTENATYTPGELLTTRSTAVAYANTYSCTSTDPTITGLTSGGSYTADLSCLSVPTLTTGMRHQIHWNNGDTSNTTSTERAYTTVAGQTIETSVSHVDSGKFAGDEVVQTLTNPALDLLRCLAEPGVTSKQGVLTMTVTG
ncbi:hypothetical protein [Conexibacter woesei]|uniref:hypothetical protein n=1 Tax=Conexibacter woesei TaxID=191495 RepID=UPI0004078DD0|nr:hypothetical protein [Conexibacter woesei]